MKGPNAIATQTTTWPGARNSRNTRASPPRLKPPSILCGLNVLTEEALQQLWMFLNAYNATEAESLGKVTLITPTPDIALHL